MDDVTLLAFEDELEKISAARALIGAGLGAVGGAGTGAAAAGEGRRLKGALIGGLGGAAMGAGAGRMMTKGIRAARTKATEQGASNLEKAVKAHNKEMGSMSERAGKLRSELAEARGYRRAAEKAQNVRSRPPASAAP